MLLGIFHFERVATPRVDTAMKRGSNILCPIKEKNVRFPSKISFFPSRPVNLHPLFLKIGHPAFCKKQAEKNRVILYSKREETRLPLLFLKNDLGFLHSVFFKKQGARFLRIVGAD